MSFSDHFTELSLHKQSSLFHLKKSFNVDCFFRPATSFARNVSSIIERYRRISFSRALAVSLLTTQVRNSRTAAVASEAVTFSRSIIEQPSFSESSFSSWLSSLFDRATSSASSVALASVCHFYSTLKSVVFTDCEISDRTFVLAVNCALGPSKTIRYSWDFAIARFCYCGVRFHIFYCNSAGLSNVYRYNWVFLKAGFVIAGSHCTVQRALPWGKPNMTKVVCAKSLNIEFR